MFIINMEFDYIFPLEVIELILSFNIQGILSLVCKDWYEIIKYLTKKRYNKKRLITSISSISKEQYYFYKDIIPFNQEDVLKQIAKKGDFDLLTNLIENNIYLTEYIINPLLESGDIARLLMAEVYNIPFDEKSLSSAIVGKNINVINYLIHKLPITQEIFDLSIKKDNLYIIDLILSKIRQEKVHEVIQNMLNLYYIFKLAMDNRSHKIINFLIKSYSKNQVYFLLNKTYNFVGADFKKLIFKQGSIDLIKKLEIDICESDVITSIENKFKVFKYIYASYGKYIPTLLQNAYHLSSLKTIKFLDKQNFNQNNIESIYNYFSIATIYKGRLEQIKYIYKNLISSKIIQNIKVKNCCNNCNNNQSKHFDIKHHLGHRLIISGNIPEYYKWLKKKQFYSIRENAIAMIYHAIEISDLEFCNIYTQLYPDYIDLTRQIRQAILNNNMPILKWYFANYYRTKETFSSAIIKSNNVFALKKINKINKPGYRKNIFNCKTLKNAIKANKTKLVKKLLKHGCPIDSECINLGIRKLPTELLRELMEKKKNQ